MQQHENIYSVSFEIPVRYSENQPAQHLIGYTSQGEGVSGLEYAYNRILRNSDYVNTVTYNCDGFGGILWGEGRHIEKCNEITSGVVTTIDYNIQHICERASEKIEKGAVLVADIKTGDILAMVSRPTYSLDDLETALNDENSPMINRCLYSYSIGSIFKLVTACEAIKSGYADFLYDCTGEIVSNGNIVADRFVSDTYRNGIKRKCIFMHQPSCVGGNRKEKRKSKQNFKIRTFNVYLFKCNQRTFPYCIFRAFEHKVF